MAGEEGDEDRITERQKDRILKQRMERGRSRRKDQGQHVGDEQVPKMSMSRRCPLFSPVSVIRTVIALHHGPVKFLLIIL